MKLRHLLITFAAVALVPFAAHAQTPTCQVGVQAGYSLANTELGIGGASIDGLGSHSTRPDVGARVGCDLTAGMFRFGAFGEWNNQDVTFSVNPGLFSASLGNSYSLGGRAGLVVGSAYIYGGAAWTHTDVDWSIPSPLLPDHVQGIMYLGGIEIPLRERFSLALETRNIRYDSEKIGGVVDLKTEQWQGMLRLNFNFGEVAPAAKPLK